MGTGDWNDGMTGLGSTGREKAFGSLVRTRFFEFAKVADSRGEHKRRRFGVST